MNVLARLSLVFGHYYLQTYLLTGNYAPLTSISECSATVFTFSPERLAPTNNRLALASRLTERADNVYKKLYRANTDLKLSGQKCLFN